MSSHMSSQKSRHTNSSHNPIIEKFTAKMKSNSKKIQRVHCYNITQNLRHTEPEFIYQIRRKNLRRKESYHHLAAGQTAPGGHRSDQRRAAEGRTGPCRAETCGAGGVGRRRAQQAGSGDRRRAADGVLGLEKTERDWKRGQGREQDGCFTNSSVLPAWQSMPWWQSKPCPCHPKTAYNRPRV